MGEYSRTSTPLTTACTAPAISIAGVSYYEQATWLSADSGWTYHWDPVAQAPWSYNAQKGLMASYDDTASVRLKTLYALQKGLGGVMFWQLTEDRFFSGGLLDVIDRQKSPTTEQGRYNADKSGIPEFRAKKATINISLSYCSTWEK